MKKGKSISAWLTSTRKDDTTSSQKHPQIKKHPSIKRHLSGSKKKGPPTKKQHIDPGSSSTPWYMKHSPKSLMDLAVHKKKIQEIQQWMEFALSNRSSHPILLMTGPSGCGKTATLHALSNEKGFQIIEWINSVDVIHVGVESRSHDWELYESQTKQFTNFLIRANRYPALQIIGLTAGDGGGDEQGGGGGGEGEGGRRHNKAKVVLVEEFPNVFIRDPKKFHHLLKENFHSLIYPLIFIVSESQHGVGTTSQLFPNHILSQLDIHCIHFNPIARTSMIKTLHKIADIECKASSKDSLPNKELFDGITDSCYGDIRSAINILQFACLKDPNDLIPIPHEESGSESKQVDIKGRQNTKHLLMGVAGRDKSLFLFRALGKILYCKRTEIKDDLQSLPSHLSHHERPHLLTDPEAVFEGAHMSSDMFTLYLHQNYIEFFQEIEDVEPAIDYLSDSDVINHMWTEIQEKRSLSNECSCSVASRGIMFSNTHTTTGKWRPLHKPQWNTVQKQYIENSSSAKSLFLHLGSSTHSHLWMPIDLQTEILPYMAIINIPLRNWDQASLLHTITSFKSYRRRYEQLGETEVEEIMVGQNGNHAKDFGMSPGGDEDITMVTLSQQSSEMTNHDEDNEIEEFDD